MKKIIAFFLAIIFALNLCACSKNYDDYTYQTVTLSSADNKSNALECTFKCPENMTFSTHLHNIYLYADGNTMGDTEIWLFVFGNTFEQFQTNNSTYSTFDGYLSSEKITDSFHIHYFADGTRVAEYYMEDIDVGITVRYYDDGYKEIVIKLLNTFSVKRINT